MMAPLALLVQKIINCKNVNVKGLKAFLLKLPVLPFVSLLALLVGQYVALAFIVASFYVKKFRILNIGERMGKYINILWPNFDR